MQALRERQVRQLVQAGTFHAKLSPGGLVEIEYLVQMLQLRHAHNSAALRTPTTAAAATALRDAGHLPTGDHAQLEAAYWFWRRLIDALRMVRGNAQDLTVPAWASEEFEFLARRLGYGGDSSRLQHDIEFHQQTVLGLARRHH
jgi:glutamate-ammonia-ligase adenylyltransferase